MKINGIVFLVVCTSFCTCLRSKRQGFLDLTSKTQVCTTPLEKPGICIDIRKCESLLELLTKHRHKPEVVWYLRKSVCSYNGDNPIVCCPELESNKCSTTRPLIEKSEPEVDNSRVILPQPDQCGLSLRSDLRIIGGTPSILGDWPWMAAIGYKSRKGNNTIYLCGGSIITNYHILTAAHCLTDKPPISVRLGDLNLYSDADGAVPVDIKVAETIIHEQYDKKRFHNDIALIRLAEPIKFTKFIRPICLPMSEEMRRKDFLGSQPFVMGWGSISYPGPASPTLLYLQIPVLKTEVCRRVFVNFKPSDIPTEIICAGFLQGGKDACKGDSGGPLTSLEFQSGRGRFFVIGVVSVGYKCAEAGYPGVYTRVTSYIDWILNKIKA